MEGYITAYSGTSMTVEVDGLGSTNIGWNLSPWIIIIVGVNGIDGLDGVDGSQGNQGPQGVQGFQGSQGPTGSGGGSSTNIGLVQAMTQGLQNIF